MHDTRADVGQDGRSSEVSAVVLDRAVQGKTWRRPAGRLTRGSRGARADAADECRQGISRGKGGHSEGWGGGSCGATADAGKAGWVPSFGARVSSSSIYDVVMMASGGL